MKNLEYINTDDLKWLINHVQETNEQNHDIILNNFENYLSKYDESFAIIPVVCTSNKFKKIIEIKLLISSLSFLGKEDIFEMAFDELNRLGYGNNSDYVKATIDDEIIKKYCL